MRGTIKNLWEVIQKECFEYLYEQEYTPLDFYCEIFREYSLSFGCGINQGNLIDIFDSPDKSREYFLAIKNNRFSCDTDLIFFLESLFENFSEFEDGEKLKKSYSERLELLFELYNLNYDLVDNKIYPRLESSFLGLNRKIKECSLENPHLSELYMEYEKSYRNLKIDDSQANIKVAILKGINFIEALGCSINGFEKLSFGDVCNKINDWPHDSLRQASKNIYGFASDYPGIRHGGNPAGKKRDLHMKDFIYLQIFTTAVAAYFLSKEADFSKIYIGS